MKKYSMVIYPYTLVKEIMQIKQELKALVGWYHSVNAEAHFTICEFFADEDDLFQIKEEVTNLITKWRKQIIRFESFDSYEGGAFYLKPDEPSNIYLEELFKSIGYKVKAIIPNAYVCTSPHLSIGRKLDKNKLSIAKKTFTSYASSFLCDGVVLREFNPNKRQYELKECIKF